MKENKRLKVIDVAKANNMLDGAKQGLVYNSLMTGLTVLLVYAAYKENTNMLPISTTALGIETSITMLSLGIYTAYKNVIKNFDISQIEQEQKEEEKGRIL